MSKNHPPKLLLAFFRWFCHPDFVEDIEGDLLERYEMNTLAMNTGKAKDHEGGDKARSGEIRRDHARSSEIVREVAPARRRWRR